MEFLKNQLYKICFNIGGRIITFTCKIINSDESFITFKDRVGKTLTYNKNCIVSCEKI